MADEKKQEAKVAVAPEKEGEKKSLVPLDEEDIALMKTYVTASLQPAHFLLKGTWTLCELNQIY